MANNKKWDISDSYVYKYGEVGKENYYLGTVLFNDNKTEPRIDSDIRGYWLIIISLPDYNPATNELGKADMFYSDMRLLVECGRRSESNYNKAISMMKESAEQSMEMMEEDRKYIKDLAKWQGISEEEMKNKIDEKKEEIMNKKKEETKMEEKKEDKKKITFDDIAGLDDVKEVMRDVIDQFNNPEKYKHFDIPPYRSLLLHGKPGTGKTFIANAFANEMDAKFVKVSLGEIGSRYQNATSNNITKLFKDARNENGNVILLLDEVDSLASKRGDTSNDKEKNNTLNTLLQEMSSDDNENIFIICATNFYELLDPAFVRSGRCDVVLEIPLPDFETRLQILELNTKRKPLTDDVCLEEISKMMDGSNCADIALLCNNAARIALKKDKMVINHIDFVEAMERMNVKKKEEKSKKIGFEISSLNN